MNLPTLPRKKSASPFDGLSIDYSCRMNTNYASSDPTSVLGILPPIKQERSYAVSSANWSRNFSFTLTSQIPSCNLSSVFPSYFISTNNALICYNCYIQILVAHSVTLSEILHDDKPTITSLFSLFCNTNLLPLI